MSRDKCYVIIPIVRQMLCDKGKIVADVSSSIFARNYGTAAVISYNLKGIAPPPPRSPSSMLDRQKPDVWFRGANIETGGGGGGWEKCISKWYITTKCM
jgi:hypothetical protein